MNPSDDQLEQELAGLRLQPLSRRFEERLVTNLQARPESPARTWRPVALAAACGLALSAVAALVVLRRPPVRIETASPGDSGWTVQSFDGSRPTVWAFRRATVDQTVDLDALLDRHRDRRPEAPLEEPPRFSVSSFRTQPRGEL